MEGKIKEIKDIISSFDNRALLDITKDNKFGHLYSNLTLIKKNVFKEVNESLLKTGIVERCEYLDGFLNIFIKHSYIFHEDNHLFPNKGKRINIEYASPNPTGPVHGGHCRGSILGDVIANIYKINGYEVTKEMYINNVGNQIEEFVESVKIRKEELEGKEINKTIPYSGEYVKEIARNLRDINKEEIISYQVKENIKDLNSLGIFHDVISYESEQEHLIGEVISLLSSKGLIERRLSEDTHDKGNILFFLSTRFGDDKDRVLQRSDGRYTYFMRDLAYHLNKIKSSYDELIIVLGEDHEGHFLRLKNGVESISNTKLTIVKHGPVKFIKDNHLVNFSKREGNIILARDIIEEVGKDYLRVMMLSTNKNTIINFQIKEEDIENSPLFYIRYSYARISSIFRQVEGFSIKYEEDINFSPTEEEVFKIIICWGLTIEKSLRSFEPHIIYDYLYNLSKKLHILFSSVRILDNSKDQYRKLSLLYKAKEILEKGGKILSIDLPSKM